MQLLGLVRAVAVAGEDLVPVHTARDALRRREDPLDVDGPVRGRLRRVVDDHLPEVGGGLERVRGQDPDLDEVLEVPVLVERREALDGVRRQRVVVATRDLEQGRRPDRPLEVDVELDLRIHQLSPVPVSGSPGRTPCAAQRFSKKTAAQIEPSNSRSTGIIWSPIETKSTPGSRTTMTMQIPTPIRRLLRSRAGREDPEAHEPEDEDRQLEEDPAREDRDDRERVVVLRTHLRVVEAGVEVEEERHRGREHDPVGEGHPGRQQHRRDDTSLKTVCCWRSSNAGARNAHGCQTRTGIASAIAA